MATLPELARAANAETEMYSFTQLDSDRLVETKEKFQETLDKIGDSEDMDDAETWVRDHCVDGVRVCGQAVLAGHAFNRKRTELADVRAELDRLRRSRRDSAAGAEARTRMVLERDAKDVRKEVKQHYAKELSVLTSRLKNTESELATAKGRIDEQDAELRRVRAQLREAEATARTAEARLDTEKTKADELEAARLAQEKADAARAKTLRLEADLANMKERRRRDEEALTATARTERALEEELEAARAEAVCDEAEQDKVARTREQRLAEAEAEVDRPEADGVTYARAAATPSAATTGFGNVAATPVSRTPSPDDGKLQAPDSAWSAAGQFSGASLTSEFRAVGTPTMAEALGAELVEADRIAVEPERRDADEESITGQQTVVESVAAEKVAMPPPPPAERALPISSPVNEGTMDENGGDDVTGLAEDGGGGTASDADALDGSAPAPAPLDGAAPRLTSGDDGSVTADTVVPPVAAGTEGVEEAEDYDQWVWWAPPNVPAAEDFFGSKAVKKKPHSRAIIVDELRSSKGWTTASVRSKVRGYATAPTTYEAADRRLVQLKESYALLSGVEFMNLGVIIVGILVDVVKKFQRKWKRRVTLTELVQFAAGNNKKQWSPPWGDATSSKGPYQRFQVAIGVLYASKAVPEYGGVIAIDNYTKWLKGALKAFTDPGSGSSEHNRLYLAFSVLMGDHVDLDGEDPTRHKLPLVDCMRAVL